MTDKQPGDKLQARIGTELRGKWTLERLIGEGGMAAVYVGLHRIGRRDAIKILHTHVASDPELRARFEQEAHAVNRFSHPGAVEIRDIDVTDDGAPFLVMELLEGESLAARGARGLVPAQELLGYIDQLLDVLARAHAEGIVHRDIKPDNLFVSPEGRLKVLDFGIARVRDGSFGRQMATRAGIALGTVSYMPPEQLSGIGVDHRADLFASGATLLRLLTGRRIHESKNHSELLMRMATLPAPKVLTVCPEVQPDVAAVIDRALAYDKHDRYVDAATMQADVRSLLRGEPPLHTGPPLPQPSQSSLPPTLVERLPKPLAVVGTPATVGGAPTVAQPPVGLLEPTNVYGPASSDSPSSLAPVVVGETSVAPLPKTVAAPTYEPSVANVVSTLPLPMPAVRPLAPAIVSPTVISARPPSVPASARASAETPDARGPQTTKGVLAMLAVGFASLVVFLVLFLIVGFAWTRLPGAGSTPTPASADSGAPTGLAGDRRPPSANTSLPPKSDPGDRDKDKNKKKKLPYLFLSASQAPDSTAPA